MQTPQPIAKEEDDFFSMCLSPTENRDSLKARAPPPTLMDGSHVLMGKKIWKEKNENNKTIINGKYTMLDVLGKGTFAKVRLAKIYDKTCSEVTPSQYFAVKIYYKLALQAHKKMSRGKGQGRRRSMTYTTALDEIYQEIEIMKVIDHPHILKLNEVIDDPDY
jgi:hypothetical protein